MTTPPATGPSEPPPAPDETLARLVHDLRNPLNTLSMNAELVGLELGERDDPSEGLREALLAIERAVGELDRGIAGLEAHVRPDP